MINSYGLQKQQRNEYNKSDGNIVQRNRQMNVNGFLPNKFYKAFIQIIPLFNFQGGKRRKEKNPQNS